MLSPSSKSRSLSPNLHSGVPERYARMTIWPLTSARRTVPVAETSKLTSSITSTNASFLRYFTSDFRHDIAPVACIVIFDESSMLRSDLTPSVVMYIFRVSVSVFWGYPKSRISVEFVSSSSTNYKTRPHHLGARRPRRNYSSLLLHRTFQSSPCPAQSICTGTRTPALHSHCFW